MEPKPDILLMNGNIWTGSPRNPYANYLACKDGRIMSVGTGPVHASDEIGTVDLGGYFTMPGFIDAHTHFRIGGASLNRLDLRSARSEIEFSEAVSTRSNGHPEGSWLIGGSWDHENWESRRLPTKELVDGFTQQFPVFLDRIDTHIALVNSHALRLAGISRNTPDPPGGVIVRDSNGDPTGIVKDAARQMILQVIPEPKMAELVRDAREAMKLANRLGVTSVSDMGPERDMRAYIDLKERGELTVRVNMVLPIDKWRTLGNHGVQANSNAGVNEWIKLGAVKAFADGSLGAGTAWFFDPYNDDNTNHGLATDILSSGELETLAFDADRNHLQLAIHAIGDKAVSRVLDIFERIQRQNPAWDRRFRIEHAQHLTEEDFARFGKLYAIASVQPYHCIDDGRWAERKIGSGRAGSAFAFRRFLDERITLALGTDWPVAPLNPMEGIHAAVTRATIDGKHPDGWNPQQKIGLEEALRAYTFGSAFASFSESEKGILDTGKLADIVVLSKNPFETTPAELKDIKVVMTVVGGKVVYADDNIFEAVRDGV